ncbi:MAG: hypothetical protein ACE5KE_13390 [Methanosarcinales archaeon]
MKEQVRKDTLKVLKEAYNAIKAEQFAALHWISDHIIHSMAVFQDKDIIDVAVALYALNKIYAKERHIKHKRIKEFTKTTLKLLKSAIDYLEKRQIEQHDKVLADLLANIQGFDKKVRVYIEDVLRFARIKKGSRLYEHGLSMGQATEAAGVTKWELMPMAGETIIHEKFVEPMPEARLKFVNQLFKVKIK